MSYYGNNVLTNNATHSLQFSNHIIFKELKDLYFEVEYYSLYMEQIEIIETSIDMPLITII